MGPCLRALPGDVEDVKPYINSKGIAHLMGPATANHDKYMITVDTEQVFYNVFGTDKPMLAAVVSRKRYDDGCSHGRSQRILVFLG